MVEVWMDMSRLMEILDEYRGGKLYPLLTADDRVIRIKIFGASQICFEIANTGGKFQKSKRAYPKPRQAAKGS